MSDRRRPSVVPRVKPSGAHIGYPTCGRWDCDDYEDWDLVGPDDPEYPMVKRERDIALYHEPRAEWRNRLAEERHRRNGGDPLWAGC